MDHVQRGGGGGAGGKLLMLLQYRKLAFIVSTQSGVLGSSESAPCELAAACTYRRDLLGPNWGLGSG